MRRSTVMSLRVKQRRSVGLVTALILASASCHAEGPSPLAIFEQRIMPIFRSPEPSSCVQCHLSSVDLKDYIRPSSRETFLSLRDQGLIDVQQPGDSKILHLIAMGENDSDSMTKRIHAKNRKAEYEAFKAWIESCCDDGDLVSASKLAVDQQAKPTKPIEVIRHTRKDRLLDSFTRKIWSQRLRCFPCHTPAELDPDNPALAKPIQRHRELVAKYGARVNLFQDTPEKTLRSLIASSQAHSKRRLPLINVENPLESLLLLKPTAKLPAKDDSGKIGKPSSLIPVTHMGGIKMHTHDHSYKAFASWLQDYAASERGAYESVDDLPKDNWVPTDHILRIKNLPEDWPELATAQVFVHRWNAEQEDWTEQPIAFTQGKVTPRKMLFGAFFALADPKPQDPEAQDPESQSLVSLEPGKVQLRIFLDRARKIDATPTLLLGGRPPDASAVISAKFEIGFKNADVVDLAASPES